MGAEQAVRASQIPERQPRDDFERSLMALQQQADPLGMELAAQAAFGVPDRDKWGELEGLARQAEELMMGTSLNTTNPQAEFAARYIYEAPKTPAIVPPIIYPLDFLYYVAHISGKTTGVKPVLVNHPALKGEGEYGYRLCAEVQALRVMGWHANQTRTFYIPVGEIYIGGFDKQGESEAIERQ